MELPPTLTLAPSGPHPVGTRSLDVAGGGPAVRAWYPAEPGTGRGPAPYVPAEQLDELAASADDAARVSLSALLDADPAAGLDALPAVLVVPSGHLGVLSSILAQELASHGDIVVVVEPRVPLPDATDEQAAAERARVIALLDELLAGAHADAIGVIDPARIAAGGHSAGGSLAFELALADERIRAVFDLDGALVREAARRTVGIPALAVLTSMGLGGHRDAFPETFAVLAATADVTVVGLDGADHFDPLDAPTVAAAFPRASATWPMGPIGPAASIGTAEMVRRFLDGVLGASPVRPSAERLVDGVPGATATADYLQLT